ncbi:MAG: hypothetical protein RSC20_01960 [Clostridiales bacterium]
MTVQEIVTLKLGKMMCPQIEIAIAEAEAYIKNYCHINVIPKDLIHIWANIAVGIYNMWDKGAGVDLAATGSLSSISMGDVSYGFAKHKTNTEYVAEIAGDYLGQLNPFRKGVFGNGNITN